MAARSAHSPSMRWRSAAWSSRYDMQLSNMSLGRAIPSLAARDGHCHGLGVSDKHRASWDEYFMNIAREVATRATCDRKHVGAVIVRDRCILATGYNGSVRG